MGSIAASISRLIRNNGMIGGDDIGSAIVMLAIAGFILYPLCKLSLKIFRKVKEKF